MDDLFLLTIWVAAVCLSLMVGYVVVKTLARGLIYLGVCLSLIVSYVVVAVFNFLRGKK